MGRRPVWFETLLLRLKADRWVYLERFSWIIIVATAVLGIPTLLIEHHFQLQRDRQNTTLEFAKLFQGAHLVSQRFALLMPWLEGKYDIENLRRVEASRADLRAIVLDMVEPITSSSAQLRSAIFDVVDFYETLQLCIENDRCDKAMAVAYFQGYAWEFYCLYQPYIEKLKKVLGASDGNRRDIAHDFKSYGDWLKSFATSQGKRPC